MIEIALGITLCVAMGKIASADDQSGILWGFLTFLIVLASMAIPLPFLRVLIACAIAFVAFILWKTVADR